MEKESKDVEEKTTVQDSSPEETKDKDQEVEEKDTTQKTDDSDGQQTKDDEDAEEMVSISKDELDKIKKSADDYNASIKLKRIMKLQDKAIPPKEEEADESDEVSVANQLDEVALLERVRQTAAEEANKVLRSSNKEEFSKNLEAGYSEWLSDNPWADNDDITTEISNAFNPGGSSKKEDIVAALDKAAINLYPNLYKESVEKKVRAKVLVEEDNIDVGDGGNGASDKNQSTTKTVTKKDRQMAERFFDGDIERYQKYKINN